MKTAPKSLHRQYRRRIECNIVESVKEKQVVRVLQSLNRSVLHWRPSYSFEIVVIRASSPAGKLYSETRACDLSSGSE